LNDCSSGSEKGCAGLGAPNGCVDPKSDKRARACARQSKNLEFSTEINIFAQFLMLMAVCGILSVAVQIAGPLWLGGLAHFAQTLSQRLTKLQESFQAGVPHRQGKQDLRSCG